MAVGDVVSVLSAANTLLSFQPAVGNMVLVSSVMRNNVGAVDIKITNGVSISYLGLLQEWEMCNMKIFIDNTNYFQINAGGGAAITSFTGIQIG